MCQKCETRRGAQLRDVAAASIVPIKHLAKNTTALSEPVSSITGDRRHLPRGACKLPLNVLPQKGKETEVLEGEARHVKRGVEAEGTEDVGSYLVPSHTPLGPLRHHPPADRTKKRCQGATLTSPLHPLSHSPHRRHPGKGSQGRRAPYDNVK